MCVIFDFFQIFRHEFFSSELLSPQDFVLVIKNTLMVSSLLFSSFMHILCDG